MTQTPSYVALKGPRLVRALLNLAVSDVELSHKHFTEKLGRLFDLSDSISLSEAHGDINAMTFEPIEVSNEAVQEEFLRVRMLLVRSIVKSFAPNAGPSLIKLPRPKVGASKESLMSFEPYKRFYAAHQREFDFKIQNLQSQVRDKVSGHSLELAKLAALDAALGDALAVHSRKFLAVTPKLLGHRFSFLLNEHQQAQVTQGIDDDPALWVLPGGWLWKFCQEMQNVLLAELEIRLQPVQGLVEALNKKVIKNK